MECVVTNFEDKVLYAMARYGIAFPTQLFPGLICKYSQFFMDGLKPIINRNPQNLTVEQKEYAVMLENLVKVE